MPNELDRRYDEELARVTGEGGRLAIGKDELGRAIVTNFPATLPAFFKTFCSLNAANEAVVAGDERLTFADLDRISDGLALSLVRRGVVKGDRIVLSKSDSTAQMNQGEGQDDADFAQMEQGEHAGHHHYISLGLVAGIEGDKVRLSATGANAVRFEEEEQQG